MRTILILFVLPAVLGVLAGLLIRWVSLKYGWRRGWLIFAVSLCYAALDTGATWHAGVGGGSDGWADLGALITGAMLFSFSLAGLAAAGVSRATLGPWAPPANRLRGALRGFLAYGLGTLLLSPVVLLLGSSVGFPGLPLPFYLFLLALAYPLLGRLLSRWLVLDSPSSLCGLILWPPLLVVLGLSAVAGGSTLSPDWWPLYGRLNFPAAVCLWGYWSAKSQAWPWLILILSVAPPALFGLGWLLARLRRRDKPEQP